jgi:hypothetical protein
MWCVTLRLKIGDDLPMLHDRLQRPRIVEWWGGHDERPTPEEVFSHDLRCCLHKHPSLLAPQCRASLIRPAR